METLTINIVNPKAKKLLEDMEDMELITINNNTALDRLERLLNKIRKVDEPKLNLSEITEEVEIARKQHEQKAIARLSVLEDA